MCSILNMLIKLCLTFCLWQMVLCSEPTGMYTVIAPATIRSNTNYTAVVSLHKADAPVTMDVAITGPSYNKTERVTLEPMSLKELTFDVPTLSAGTYQLQATGVTGLEFKEQTDLIVAEKKPLVTLIQTDKAKYKPGDLVQFRVIFLDENTRPAKIDTPITITVIDGGKNRLKQWKNIELNKGVYSADFQLSEQPVLGDWTIEANIADENVEKKSFEVAKYVLPKFEVTVDTAKDVALAEENIQVTVRAKYTYGKPVKGRATIKIDQVQYWGIRDVTDQQTMQKSVDVDGKGRVEFNLVKDLGISTEHNYYIAPLNVQIAMEEALTGNIQNASATINLHYNRYKIEVVESPRHFNKNENVTFKIAIKDVRGAPVQDTKTPIKLTLSSTPHFILHSSDVIPKDKNLVFESKMNENSVATFNFNLPNAETGYYNIECQYMDVTQNLQSIHLRENSKEEPNKDTTSILELAVQNEQLKLDEPVLVNIKSKYELPYFVYVLVARGNIELMEYVTVPEKSKNYTIKFMPTFRMTPHASLYVHYVNEKELRFEETHIDFGKKFENFIDIDAKPQAKAGEQVDLKISTQPDSFVGLLGVDQSVLLLKSGNDLSKDEVFDKLSEYDTTASFRGGFGRIAGQKSGVVTLTNAEYDKQNINYFLTLRGRNGIFSNRIGMSYSPMVFGSPAPMAASIDIRDKSSAPTPPKIRKDFSETWMFSNISTENTSEDALMLSKKIPDTITSWVVTGFSINSKSGLALSETPTKIKVFQPFFVSTYLPYSVKRGEIVSIPVIIFNYMEKALDVEVIMDNSDKDYEFVEVTNEVQEKYSDEVQRTKRLTVLSNTGKTVSFLIHPNKIGDIPLKIKAISPLAGDAINQMLKVEPEGITKYGNKANFVNLKENLEQNGSLIADIPMQIVPESEYIEFVVVGDLLGPTIQNLDNLVRMPYGCGEQNMVNFVPNILVMQYLKTIKKSQPKLMERARKFMEVGYQRELTYKHEDGSYSAFGKVDKKGSTWLTAYVVRSFHQAMPFIDIDPKIIEQGLKFLSSVQVENGSFQEHGKLFDNADQSELALTSFVLLAFLENKENLEQYSPVVNKALNFLDEAVAKTEDIYALAIAALAAQQAEHPLGDKVLAKLEQSAKHEGDLKWWSPTPAPTKKPSYYSQNNEVETTAYILLSLLKTRSLDETLPILKWLVAQRNSNGGFASTKDTVLGLEAVIKFAKQTGSGKSDLDITFSSDDAAKSTGVVNVNNDNSLLMQTHVLPKSLRQMQFNAKGSGIALVQLAYRYNVVDKEKAPKFKLDVTIKDKQEGRLLLQVCATYIPPDNDNKESNMVVQEVSLPSGYTVEKEVLENLVNTLDVVKRVETKDSESKAVVYYESLKPQENVCINISASRSYDVAKQKPAPVTIYDYYDPSSRSTEFYEVESSLNDISHSD